jgi:ABC-type transport system involved in multi-copper enzyme maturation permease subunit
MHGRTVRLKKEARALLWPWCVVMLAGVLAAIPYLSHSLRESIGFLGLLGGIPLLAALPFGNEFQHRTFSFLLSQPAARADILREKLIVAALAVVSASVVFFFSWVREGHWALASLYLVASTASGTFWTLSARSTMGGLALSAIPLTLFQAGAIGLGINLWHDIPAATIAVLAALALGYASLTLWLGARKLANFQVTGGIAGGDLVMAGPSFLPDAWTGWFRYRPAQPILNLIRKELRLLRALWTIALPAVAYLIFLTVFKLLPDHAHVSFENLGRLELALAPLMAMPLMAILAGCLSLGEERASGTHSWHMTLPIPAGRQWLIKVLSALFMGFLCAGLLPAIVLLLGGNLSFGGPVYMVDPRAVFDWMYMAPVLTLAGFWFACAVNGTMSAAVLFVPATALVYLAARIGGMLGQQLAALTGTLRDVVVARFQLSPLAFTNGRSNGLVWLLVLLVAVIQSYWLFRTIPQDSIPAIIRRLVPVTLTAFLCGFCLNAVWTVNWQPFPEVQDAMERLHVDGRTGQLATDDLSKASTLSPLTRRWLHGSSIAVAPDQRHAGYSATIRLAGGLDCTLAIGHFQGKTFNPIQPSCADAPGQGTREKVDH